MAKARYNTRRAPRRTQLFAETVSVCCAYCGEPQPSPREGSEFWTREDFLHVTEPIRECVSCEERILISCDSKANFQ